MEKHVTENNNDTAQPKAGNDPLSNNPAGSADIEKGKPGKNITEMPETGTPEVEKPERDEVPERDEPEIEETDIEEAPDTDIDEIPKPEDEDFKMP